MKSPFKHIDEAFDVFYDEDVVVECKDGRSQTIRAFVCLDNTAEAFSGDVMDTVREDIAITVRKEDWAFAKTLVRGDKISRPCTTRKYAVSEVVEDYNIGIIVKARQV